MNDIQSNGIGKSRPPAFPAALAAIATLLSSTIPVAQAEPGNDNRAPDVPELKVPDGNKVAFHAFAVGVQIYQWSGSAWVFVAPEAVLFADAGDRGEVGIHYVGPTWESESGSKVVGTVKVRKAVPDSIPWLLLEAVSTGGPGIFDRVTYIQRVNTVGGTAPSDPGSVVGARVEVPYTAEYVFYRKHE